MKLIIQIPCWNEAQHAAADARRAAARAARLRRRGVARDRRRLDRRDGRGGAPRTASTTSSRLTNHKGLASALPGRPGRLPEAGRRRDRQHRRRQPVPRARRREAGAPILEGRADMVVGDREVATIEHFSPLKKRPAAAGLVGRAPGLLDVGARHDLGLPRLQPRGRAADAGRLEIHLHPGDDHPGRQAAGRDRPRPGPHQPGDARVAPVPLDGGLRAPQRDLDLPHLRAVRAAAGLLEPRRRDRPRRAGGLDPLRRRLRRRQRQGPRAVADPRRGAVHRRRRAVGARRDRRPAGRAARDDPADVRARAAHRAATGRRALALRTGRRRRSDVVACDRRRRGARSDRRARGGAELERRRVTISRDGDRHRQHLRQVRLHQPARAPPDGAASSATSTSCSRSPTRTRCSTSAAARACWSHRWAQRLRERRVVGIDLEEDVDPGRLGAARRRPTSSTG